ncbi:MAG: phosphoethanolamine--lipid A transferase [Gammaproteobacteria bacterium]
MPGFHDLLLFAGLLIAVTALQFAVLALLLTRRTVRPVLAVLFVATAFATFYMDRYSVFIDTDMLQNVLHTDWPEARELLTPALGLHLLLYAGLPLLILSRIQIKPRTLSRALGVRLLTVAGALALTALVVFPQFRAVSSLIRNHREVGHLVTPTNYLSAGFRLVRKALAAPTGPLAVIAADARRADGAAIGRRPKLLVLAIGETVRSANFGLSGYTRDTTPELQALDLVVYPRVRACGTSTEVSVPCIFAPVGRRAYDEARIRREQSLLHVLDRVGFKVLWLDNQSGCKGVCAGLHQERIAGDADSVLCDGERCLDAVLLPRLAAAARESGDLVVVLHLLGNHGPAYFRRYPDEFRRFTPTCDSGELRDCSDAEIVNAYDNAILYTDHVLAAMITYLQNLTDRDTALIYVSDHGESLGENGIYLHGLPYAIAPDVQREVPMLMWLSKGLLETTGVDENCLRAGANGEIAHDNIFHSVLGLLDVTTTVREPSLDLFAGCRRPATAAQAATQIRATAPQSR